MTATALAPALAPVPASAFLPLPSAPRQQPRRILMTTDAVGSAWTYSVDLCRQLTRRGIQVMLATMGPLPDDAQRREVRALSGVRLVESSFQLEWMDDPWDDVRRASFWLMRLDRLFSPDLIHLNGYVHATLPWSAPVVVMAHSCVCSWWRAVHHESPPARYRRYADAVRRGLEAADLVIAPTDAMLDALCAAHGRPARPVVIPNGTDHRRFHRAVKARHILAAGQLGDRAKNLDNLCRIAPTLPWPIHLAGRVTGPDSSKSALPGVVRLGQCPADAMAMHFAQAAIFALPARYEPFGLVALEAASSGCALVLGDIPSLREVWDDAALYVSPDDPLALRRALLRLIDDEDFRYRQGSRALTQARRFTAAAMAASYLEACTDLLDSRATSLCRTARRHDPLR